jgi:hypothetical protein
LAELEVAVEQANIDARPWPNAQMMKETRTGHVILFRKGAAARCARLAAENRVPARRGL